MKVNAFGVYMGWRFGMLQSSATEDPSRLRTHTLVLSNNNGMTLHTPSHTDTFGQQRLDNSEGVES
jgi:hypothetical protein